MFVQYQNNVLLVCWVDACRKPNGERAQDVFQRAAKVGSLISSRKRIPLCKDTQAAFYNLGVCLRDNIGAPLRTDGESERALFV